MKASDYIVEFLIDKGITDVFGYPGGMVTHLMDSFAKYKSRINAHVTYHEQGAAFAACGFAQTSGKPGVAYATSGPGATNLITGICNAWFDSIPTIFITGQVNSNEARGSYAIRQRGFQETDIISIVKSITKYSVYVDSAEKLPEYLNEAYHAAITGRMGPVLLDIPMNVFRTEIDVNYCLNTLNFKRTIPETLNHSKTELLNASEKLQTALCHASCPCILIGNGVKASGKEKEIKEFIDRVKIPVVTSMVAFDVLENDPYCYGFIGAYGTRTGNFIAAKSDLIISIGSRMDIRQVGALRENFAPEAEIIRFDIDDGELGYPVHSDEIKFCMSMDETLEVLNHVEIKTDYSKWIDVCEEIRSLLKNTDKSNTAELIEFISHYTPENSIITTDVGQNQVWVAQSFHLKKGQRVLFSGGHGAMGYSLPASIGAYYGSVGKHVVCITGDGGMQMNIQELQFIAREKLPIKIIVLNNNALGMIRHFQEMYFDSRYFQTKPDGGYTAPSFTAIGHAYGIQSVCAEMEDLIGGKNPEKAEQIRQLMMSDEAALIEIEIRENTYVTPKLEFGKPNQDQEPLLPRDLYEYIMNLKP